MRKILTLEAARPVLLDPSSTFVDEVTTFSRQIFDTNGRSAVAFRPSDRVVSTVRGGMHITDESELRYFHFAAAGLDSKRLGSKIYRAKERLDAEPGDRTTIFDEVRTPVEQRAGEEPLEATLNAIAENEYDFDPDELPGIVFDDVEAVEATMMAPNKKLIVLRSRDLLGRTAASMYCRMSQVTNLAVTRTLRRESELERSPQIDGVKIGETRNMDPAKMGLFIAHVAELLPIRAQLGPVELNASL